MDGVENGEFELRILCQVYCWVMEVALYRLCFLKVRLLNYRIADIYMAT